MAVAEEPFNLVPSCSHHFYLVFLFYGWVPAKRRRKKLVVFILVAKGRERKVCVQRLGGENRSPWSSLSGRR